MPELAQLKAVVPHDGATDASLIEPPRWPPSAFAPDTEKAPSAKAAIPEINFFMFEASIFIVGFWCDREAAALYTAAICNAATQRAR